MNSNIQEDDTSPLVDIFLQDQPDSDSENSSSSSSSTATPLKTLKRLHIHLDMTSTQYLRPSPHHIHHHTEHIHGSGHYASADLDSYSAVRLPEPPTLFFFPFSKTVSGVSSFNYPVAADSTLLTPISSSGTPPLQQRSSTKTMRAYHHSQGAVSGAQGPTPPNSSKIYYNSYEMNSNSQGSSPMTVQPHVTESGQFDMSPYMAHSPPGSHHPSSPKHEIPPPIDPYLGHFTVSGGSDAEVAHHPFQEYHHFTNVEVDPSGYLVRQQQQRQSAHVSLVFSNIFQYRTQTTPRIGGIEDLRDPGMLLGNYPSHASLSPGRRAQPRKKPTPARKMARTPKASPRPGALDEHSMSNSPMDGEDKDELTLRDDAPDDDKYIFQLRKEFISEKGKGMWEEMKAKYSEKHQGNWEKAALQMKVSRAVAKFGVWPTREIERLKEAHRYYEEKRYQLILARMKENGGCKVWDWKPQHIEAMLVKLGAEEPTIDEKTGTRRRKNKAARRQANSQNGVHHHHPSSVMNDWSNGLGLHPAFQGHAHHVVTAASGRQASFDILSDEASIAPTFTSEQENEYLDQIFNKPARPEGSLSPELMEITYNDDDRTARPPTRDLNNHHSERVARQACEQLMQQQQHTRLPEHAYASQ
ncbi:hypothetical protein B0T17DRAFT_642778 [Bombardia bombarda]|uniref:Uncharacterized protein n=1 Tax=Bombardia bombarda TaxID=252184 RepID=A0AA40BY44_9PEZI|nr:hypothetical protein B0T17DRAFT_642778 [Bombardia bombarda]